MALDSCNNCPQYCLGLEYSTDCGYVGTDIPSVGVSKGESLTGALEKMASAQTPEPVDSSTITTDDVMTTSAIRNMGSLCASKILTRDIEYKVSVSNSVSMFSWDLGNVVNKLPSGFNVAFARIRGVGRKVGNSSVIFDAENYSAAQTIALDRYPLTVDITLRLVTECGNVDMTKSIYIHAAAPISATRAYMDVQDVVTGSSTSDYKLTDQLDILELNMQTNMQKLNEVETMTLNGRKVNFKDVVAANNAEIENIQVELDDPSSFVVGYTNDGLTSTDTITNLFTALYSEIQTLKEDLDQKNAQIVTLQAQVESLL